MHELVTLPGDPQEDDAAALASESRRELDGRDRACRLDDDVEQTADQAARLGLGVLLGDVHDLVRAERARELELLVAEAVGDDSRGRAQPRDPDRERAHRSDSHHADGLGRLDPCTVERLHDARARLDETRSLERDVVGEGVEHARRNDDVLAPAAAAREADGVVALAEVRVARAAARALHAADVPLAHDALSELEPDDVLAERVDDAAPLVAGDDRKANPALIQSAGRDVEVGAADTGDDAADARLVRSGRRHHDVSECYRVRLVDDDRSHAPPSLALSGCGA